MAFFKPLKKIINQWEKDIQILEYINQLPFFNPSILINQPINLENIIQPSPVANHPNTRIYQPIHQPTNGFSTSFLLRLDFDAATALHLHAGARQLHLGRHPAETKR